MNELSEEEIYAADEATYWMELYALYDKEELEAYYDGGCD